MILILFVSQRICFLVSVITIDSANCQELPTSTAEETTPPFLFYPSKAEVLASRVASHRVGNSESSCQLYRDSGVVVGANLQSEGTPVKCQQSDAENFAFQGKKKKKVMQKIDRTDKPVSF